MKLILAALAILSVMAAASGCGGSEARRTAHMVRGQKYLDEGKLEKARVEFADALQIAPNDAQARYLSGRVAERLGDVRAAASLYHGAIDVDPKNVPARARLARLYLLTRSPDKALKLIDAVLAAQPDDPDLLAVRAGARAQMNDRVAALEDAEHAVRVAPANEDAVATLAELYRTSGEPQRAIEVLQRATAHPPRSPGLQELLARIYLLSGEDQLAEQQLLSIVQSNPGELGARLQLAAFYVHGKRLDEAERTLRDAATAMPESDEAKVAYVDFLIANRPAAEAEAALTELIARYPRAYDLPLRLAELQQRAGRTEQALGTYRALIAGHPNEPAAAAARDRIAAIDLVAGKDAEVRTLLAETLASNAHDDDALTLRANLELRHGDAESAIADLRAVLHDRPEATAVLRTLARAHLANHEATLAEENLRTALAAAPRDVGVRVDLGELLTRTHRADDAVALLEQTVTDTPDAAGAPARAALIEAYLAKADLPAARRAAEDLKTLQPESDRGWYLAGLVAQQQSRPDDAQREFEHALQLQPAATDALTALARLQFERGQHARAITLVQGAVQRAPDSAAAHNLLGELYLGDKSYPESTRAFTDAARLAPAWWIPYANLARARSAAGDAAGCLAAYEAGVRATGEPALVVGLATLYEQQGHFDDAIRQYEILHQHDPRLELAANNLAMLLVTYRRDQGSLDRARDLTAAFANSDVGALLDTRGWIMFKRGELPEALATLQRAAARAPDSRVILYHLGMAQLKSGQTDKARASLETAVANGASFPGTEEARLALAQLAGRTG
jgi:Tfp pilus assembly protein PilF